MNKRRIIKHDSREIEPARPSDTANSRGWPRLQAAGTWASGSVNFIPWEDPVAQLETRKEQKIRLERLISPKPVV